MFSLACRLNSSSWTILPHSLDMISWISWQEASSIEEWLSYSLVLHWPFALGTPVVIKLTFFFSTILLKFWRCERDPAIGDNFARVSKNCCLSTQVTDNLSSVGRFCRIQPHKFWECIRYYENVFIIFAGGRKCLDDWCDTPLMEFRLSRWDAICRFAYHSSFRLECTSRNCVRPLL